MLEAIASKLVELEIIEILTVDKRWSFEKKCKYNAPDLVILVLITKEFISVRFKGYL